MYVCTRAKLENPVCDGGPGSYAEPTLARKYMELLSSLLFSK